MTTTIHSRITAALCGTALALGAANTFAGGPLFLNPADADGVERWPAGGANIPFNIDQGGLGPQNNAQATADILAAFAAWEGVATASNAYQDNGQLAFDVDVTNFAPFLPGRFFGGPVVADGLSPVVLDEDGSIFAALFGAGTGVLGFAGPDIIDPVTGIPLEATCFLNGGAILAGFPLSDFQGVEVHEFGHYSGMAHTVVNGQNIALGDTSGPTPDNTYGNAPGNQVETMFPFALQGGGQVTPHADDIGILSFMYPEAGFFAGSATISGTILASNETTALTGVNVIARNVADPFVDAVSAISGDRGAAGAYTLNGLSPGADYTVHVDQILQGGFSTPPIALPGPEEFYNGAAESNNISTPDQPDEFVTVSATAGGTAAGIDVIFNSFGPGDPLPVGDDGFVELFLPFTFNMCGQDFDSVFVNANGNVTFGAGSSDFTDSVAEHLNGPPRIAGVWDDLSPFNLFTGVPQGKVSFDIRNNHQTFVVSYENVPEFANNGSNSFDIILRGKRNVNRSNPFRVEYGDMTVEDGLAGFSCGLFATSGAEMAADLSAETPPVGNRFSTAEYEQFNFLNTNDLANSSIVYARPNDLQDHFEFNNTFASATGISLPFNSNDLPARRITELAPEFLNHWCGQAHTDCPDVDVYWFPATGGETLIAEVTRGQMDSLMCLFDASGTLVAVDDDGGSGLLSRIQYEVPSDQELVVAVSTFPDFNCSGNGNSHPVFGQGRYTLDLTSIFGTPLSLGDDTFQEVGLDFSFPFQGVNYNSVFVNSNGNLTFGAGDTDFSDSVVEFLANEPRIAGLWDDLSPNQGGMVLAAGDSNSATISFQNVPQFVQGDSNSFAMTIRADGTITVDYNGVDAVDGLVGVTPGGGLPGGPGAVDLSTSPTWGATGSTYEQFSGGNPLDLDPGSQDYNP